MKRLFFVAVSLAVVSCAHQSAHQATARVVVMASPDASHQFDAATFAQMTRNELRPTIIVGPRPLTLTVQLDAADRLLEESSHPTLASGKVLFWATVFDGVSDHHGARAVPVANVRDGVSVVRGWYTISDVGANVLEMEPIVILGSQAESQRAGSQVAAMRRAADFLADRVAAVELSQRDIRPSGRRSVF
jgi:hypothetical protein